ncbi:hypothetical protein E4P42_17860 [Mycobacterium sp. PS03-16]|uniref:hypothetical protein n=1 Tax=Mycobacterium sp. PS03-16 TaxID=2559611 RepID=UPI0010749346|nr:hypothetical protein [Mycobacterium sp. PS03-16]TFV56826.1 hypothetical protein E4P42_17860 [Mycobacterium sp. PS03-16]
MHQIDRPLAVGAVAVLLPMGMFASAGPARADCTNAGGVTVCAQGDVRGSDGGTGGGSAGPYYPYPCEYDYYCDDWGVDLILDVDGPDGDLGRPGRPGAGPDNSLPGGNRGGGGRRGGRR